MSAPTPSPAPWKSAAPRGIAHVRLALGLLLVFGLCQALRRAPTAAFPTPTDALVRSLARDQQVRAATTDIHWSFPESPTLRPRETALAWFLGQHLDATPDVYLARTQVSAERQLLAVDGVFNLTETRSTSEHSLAAAGNSVAWASGDGERVYRVNWLEFDRSPLALNQSLSWLAAWQWRLTWLERFGSTRGATLRTFKLVPPVASVKLEFQGAHLVIGTPLAVVDIPPEAPPQAGGRYVAEQPSHLPRPGNLVTWAVDRLRAVPWFGDENMQRLKAVAYHGYDWLERAAPGLFRGDPADYALTIQAGGADRDATQGVPNTDPGKPHLLPSATANAPAPANTSWPPQDLELFLTPALDGEGRWLNLDGDPFIRHDAEGHVPFVTTFLRTDAERADSRVTLVAWDPARVELHMMSGTEEPKSATFETGTGLVPRDPEVLKRFVGAFNGGFQYTHGEFGMMVDRLLFVPPRPYAATIAELTTGETAFGTWPLDSDVPSTIQSFRQNLTPLIAHGKYNPYHREWWGGVPAGWEDDTRTVRSGLCVTKVHQLIYFYGSKVDPTNLGKAMLRADCEFAMHLDMNQGHTGLEFYHVAEASKLPPLALPLSPMWQAEGEVEDAPGYRFRGRRLFRSMQLMNFPRYIQRETRDFFYLTLRKQLPSDRIRELPNAESAAVGEDGNWTSVPGLTNPIALATTTLRPRADLPESRVLLLELDPQRLSPKQPLRREAPISWRAPTPAPQTLWWDAGQILLATQAPSQAAVALFSGQSDSSPLTRSAVGRHPSRGTLLVAEIIAGTTPGEEASLLSLALAQAGVVTPLFLDSSPDVVLGGADLSGHPAQAGVEDVRWLPRTPEVVRELFSETPIVPPHVWQPLQRKTQHEPAE